MTLRYVGTHTATLENEDGKRVATLLWGDPLHELGTSGSRTRVLARGWDGWIETSAISDRSLLEVYIIDVGQGDGVLVKTPEGNWFLVDAGRPLGEQMTKKGAANFIRWKFLRDLRMDGVVLESIVVSHPDADHFGGVIDLLRGQLWEGTTFDVEVGTLYHSGLPRFDDDPELGPALPGEVPDFPVGFRGVQRNGSFHEELLGDASSFASPPRPFSELFGEYGGLVATVPGSVERLSADAGFLRGYEPGDQAVTVRVLAPILEEFAPGRRGLRRLESDDAKTLNGHSVVLRLDYGAVRILLTGDLNERSQRLLRSYVPDEELSVDVAKACHHGAEDVDLDFVAAMEARVTVISSGDNEDYAHPRPVLMGASARYGREGLDLEGARVPPLVYSTELARSVKLGFPTALRVEATGDVEPPRGFQLRTDPREARFVPLERVPVSTDLVYGLVNVRTDGETVLCATLEERGNEFDVKLLRTGP